jgi:hypothetical protein
MVTFYIDGERVLSDDPRLVVYLVHHPRPAVGDCTLLRYQLRAQRGVKLVSVGVYVHGSKTIFGVN